MHIGRRWNGRTSTQAAGAGNENMVLAGQTLQYGESKGGGERREGKERRGKGGKRETERVM